MFVEKNCDGRQTFVIEEDALLKVDGTARVSREIAKSRTSSFFIFNLNTVVELYEKWTQELPHVKPFYAVKCNNDPLLLKILAKLGASFDCASPDEIAKIVDTGVNPSEQIIYAHPCKNAEDIAYANDMGVKMMTFDCVEELYKIRKNHASAELVLRIIVSDATALRILDAKFGCDPVKMAPALLKAAKTLGLPVIGISFHVGSGSRNSLVYRQAISEVRKLFDVGREIGLELNLIDIGGGFDSQDMTSFEQCSEIIRSALEDYFPKSRFKNLRICAEPGRFFATTPFSLRSYVNTVIERKDASMITMNPEDRNISRFLIYINDGLNTAFGHLRNRLNTTPIKATFLDDESTRQKYPSVVIGPDFEQIDDIIERSFLPKLKEGDWLFYPNMGAYTIVTAMPFNGRTVAEIICIVGDKTWNSLSGSVGSKA